jgi:hypothetical protein
MKGEYQKTAVPSSLRLFIIAIPYTDLRAEPLPLVWSGCVAAASEEEAHAMLLELLADKRRLFEAIVDEVEDCGLKDPDFIAQWGIVIGHPSIEPLKRLQTYGLHWRPVHLPTRLNTCLA